MRRGLERRGNPSQVLHECFWDFDEHGNPAATTGTTVATLPANIIILEQIALVKETVDTNAGIVDFKVGFAGQVSYATSWGSEPTANDLIFTNTVSHYYLSAATAVKVTNDGDPVLSGRVQILTRYIQL